MILENETHLSVQEAEYAIAQEAASLDSLLFSEQDIAEANAWFDERARELAEHLNNI